MLFEEPVLTTHDETVLGELEGFRKDLAYSVRDQRRWTGRLRRSLQARAIKGSNSIEGYDVSLDDALAAVDAEDPLDADAQTWAEIRGYRTAMTYVQQLASVPEFRLETSLINSLHFMMLSHELRKSPGQVRRGPIYVFDGDREEKVYEGPEWRAVPALIDELVLELNSPSKASNYVRAAMAHLNLVMIHPYRDGNGRMARALQTLILARGGILAAEFSSIEEYLGAPKNTPEYYGVLADTGAGSWNPGRSSALWVSYNLRAHHIQAQTVARRVTESSDLWSALEEIAAAHRLPERTVMAMWDAALGFRVRRSAYAESAELEDATATRDLRIMVAAELLIPHGATRGRTYTGSSRLRDVYRKVRSGRPAIRDPYENVRDWSRP